MKKKNPHAVALGKLGATASNASRTPEERKAQAKKAIETRWANKEPSQSASARSHRKQRQAVKCKHCGTVGEHDCPADVCRADD